MLHLREVLDCYATFFSALNEKDLVRLRAELYYHGGVVVLGVRVRPNQLATFRAATEKQDVKSVCLCKELLL